MKQMKMSKGIFWFFCSIGREGVLSFSGEILSLPVPCDADGNPTAAVSFNSQNGRSNTHKNSWMELTARRKELRKFSWNYFPRGRVEMFHGKAFIFINPQILNCENFLVLIKREFHIEQLDVRVKIDNSAHYQCTILDEI
ncbi:hypothetical protein AALB16_02910 [Lachnospiraceae bacterium 62-35]